MVTRTMGIVMGVTLTLLFTITVLPSSAHNSIDRNLLVAMRELLSLHCLCWLPITDTELLKPPEDGGEWIEGDTRQLKASELEEIALHLTAGCLDAKGAVKTSENCTVAVRAASAPFFA
jgi:hypothetical protein